LREPWAPTEGASNASDMSNVVTAAVFFIVFPSVYPCDPAWPRIVSLAAGQGGP
jgi:hypothetical protein